MAPLLKCSLFIVLLTLVAVEAEGNGPVLHRQKREWISAPRQLQENQDYTGLSSIARIRSDKENITKVFYYLSGPGVDEPPIGVFEVIRNTGFIKINSILDREEIPFYNLQGIAKYANGGIAENNIVIRITVVDVNDCPPVIKAQQVGSVSESSTAGTVVMKVIATDNDQENTSHSAIAYRITEQSNQGGMFYINRQTGEIIVQRSTLDREKHDTYKLMIIASDLGGRDGGNTGTGEIEIKILDINDNVPVLEKEWYEGNVEENTINVEVMRIRAIDMDLIGTDNWLAVFKIISGNEGGYFSITTDTKTNEGIIMIHKALDYEELKVLNLQVAVSNKAAYNFGTVSPPPESIIQKSYNVKINVDNQNEGPRFHPNVKVVTLSEEQTSIDLKKIITNYAAIDTDTLQVVTNVRYAKFRDTDNWLIIDENTADIRLYKVPDRESKYLVNGTYYAQILCTTNEIPSKTATGTIAIQVEDFNDHCPTLTSTTQTMCQWDTFMYVTAVDQDDFPNSAPFQFTVIPENSKGKWNVEPFNDTTVILREEAKLWPGIYKVSLDVKDRQGKSCSDVQMMDVTVCSCKENTKSCKERSSMSKSFGAPGVLLLLLGLLLLLLVPLLLLFCLCGGAADGEGFKKIPYETKQQLISYHTEGQGEDKDIPDFQAPVEVDIGTINTKDRFKYNGNNPFLGQHEFGGAAGGQIDISTIRDKKWYEYNKKYSGQAEVDINGGMIMREDRYRYRAGMFDEMALSEEFLGEYYSSKYNLAAQQSQEKDAMLVYNYEGRESLAGSVGCCSLLENDDDLAFLNDLGPKFKTLAEICKGSAIVTKSADAVVPVRLPVSPVKPTYTHTEVDNHREMISDMDQVNINTHNTTNVTSGSSTIVQERFTQRNQGSATVPKVSVQDKIVIPNQTVLLQQPTMYYTTTPMYVVEPNPQVVLVAGGTQQPVGQLGLSQGVVQVGGLQGSQGVLAGGTQQAVGQVGLSQGLVQVGGLQGSQVVIAGGTQPGVGQVGLSQGLVHVGGLQGSQVVIAGGTQQGVGQVGLSQGLVQVGGLQGSQGVVLVDRHIGGLKGKVTHGLSQGSTSTSRQVLVNGGSAGGEHVAYVAQGLVQMHPGSKEKGLEVGSQGKDYAKTATPMLHGSQRVVVQQKKVSVTESTI